MANTIEQQNPLRFYRLKLGYKQREVAALLDCTERQLQRCENGHQLPNVELLVGLSILYGETPGVLLSGLYEAVRRRLDARSLPSERQPGVARVLALDPWTRGVGLAVLDQDVVVHSGMHRVEGTSVERWFADTAPGWAESVMNRYRPQVLAVPATVGHGERGRRGQHAQAFLAYVRELSISRGVVVVDLPLPLVESTMRDACSPDEPPLVLPEVERPLRYEDYLRPNVPRAEPQPVGRQVRLNKARMAAIVAARFPSLAPQLPPARKAFTPQRPRESQFFAVALAMTAAAQSATSVRG